MEPFLFIFISLLSIALLVFGIVLLRRTTWWMPKTIATIAIAAGAIMIITIVAGGMITSNLLISTAIVELAVAIGIAAAVFWVAMLADCALHEERDADRLVWVLIVIFAQFVGALIYYFGRRPARIRKEM